MLIICFKFMTGSYQRDLGIICNQSPCHTKYQLNKYIVSVLPGIRIFHLSEMIYVANKTICFYLRLLWTYKMTILLRSFHLAFLQSIGPQKYHNSAACQPIWMWCFNSTKWSKKLTPHHLSGNDSCSSRPCWSKTSIY